IFMALVGPLMNDWEKDGQDLVRHNLSPKAPFLADIHWLPFDGYDNNGNDVYAQRGVEDNFWFGTDRLGRDLWTRVWLGTRISLLIAFVAAAIDFLVGVIYGGISGYFGGMTDDVM